MSRSDRRGQCVVGRGGGGGGDGAGGGAGETLQSESQSGHVFFLGALAKW